MKSTRLKVTRALLFGLVTWTMMGGGGCASIPAERPDSGKIRQDADEGMRDLQKEEEDRHR